ncbi:hypothetical protein AVEN_215344-1 [Araneus ventricosus]|uniref:Uncharacterized protein n=1 Tax=Araneus ventricosus TaxID=182803 RepID=A0A4Y2GEA0_ARAVE|nr:hypothetical protein AVEN_215344-1 [Araneus ventricosus]
MYGSNTTAPLRTRYQVSNSTFETYSSNKSSGTDSDSEKEAADRSCNLQRKKHSTQQSLGKVDGSWLLRNWQ